MLGVPTEPPDSTSAPHGHDSTATKFFDLPEAPRTTRRSPPPPLVSSNEAAERGGAATIKPPPRRVPSSPPRLSPRASPSRRSSPLLLASPRARSTSPASLATPARNTSSVPKGAPSPPWARGRCSSPSPQTFSAREGVFSPPEEVFLTPRTFGQDPADDSQDPADEATTATTAALLEEDTLLGTTATPLLGEVDLAGNYSDPAGGSGSAARTQHRAVRQRRAAEAQSVVQASRSSPRAVLPPGSCPSSRPEKLVSGSSPRAGDCSDSSSPASPLQTSASLPAPWAAVSGPSAATVPASMAAPPGSLSPRNVPVERGGSPRGAVAAVVPEGAAEAAAVVVPERAAAAAVVPGGAVEAAAVVPGGAVEAAATASPRRGGASPRRGGASPRRGGAWRDNPSPASLKNSISAAKAAYTQATTTARVQTTVADAPPAAPHGVGASPPKPGGEAWRGMVVQYAWEGLSGFPDALGLAHILLSLEWPAQRSDEELVGFFDSSDNISLADCTGRMFFIFAEA